MSGAEPDGDATARQDDAAGEYEVELDHEGETITLTVAEDESILDAAEDAGLDLSYSCRQGQCTSCVGKLQSGSIDQSKGTALDPMQKEDGYALLCIATPTADCQVETEAQEDLFGMDIL